MSDVNAFIDAIGKDVNAALAPRIEGLVREFAAALIQDVFQRYQPELAGELRTRIVSDGVELVGRGVRLDVKHRDTGALISSLDVPVSMKIRVDPVSVTLTETTIALDLVR